MARTPANFARAFAQLPARFAGTLLQNLGGRGTAQWPSEVGKIYAARSLPEISQISAARSVPGILQISAARSVPGILQEFAAFRSLSQAHLRQPIPGCTDKAQKPHAILLELSCKFKTAHRCILFARQLFFFKSAKSSAPHRYVKNAKRVQNGRRPITACLLHIAIS